MMNVSKNVKQVWSVNHGPRRYFQGQDSLIDPEDDESGDTDGWEEGVGAVVIAGMDALPVLELPKHVLDLVATVIQRLSKTGGRFLLDFGGMQGVMRRAMRAGRNQSASYPLSANSVLARGSASIISAAPL